MNLFAQLFLAFFAASAVPATLAVFAGHVGGFLSIGLAFLLPAALAGLAAWLASSQLEDSLDRVQSMEDRFLQEKSRVDSLVNNIPDGIIMADLRGEVQYINDAAMSILGASSQQTQLRDFVQSILKRRTQADVVELPVSTPAGPVMHYYHTTVTLFSPPGKEDFGILLVMRDVTMERELARMKEDFFHSAAHDLRAPVFAVQGYLRLLEKNARPDPKSGGYFAAIYQACEKLLLFIQDILDTYRMESGQLKLNFTSIEPLSFLERLKSMYGPAAEETGLALELQLPQDYPGSIEADERLLERVFQNLISNAIKATPRGGKIRISMAPAGDKDMDFSVSDTGVGIPKEKKTRLFEKYYQIQPNQDRSGYGLGLHICRRIVELHGGSIWVESEPGKGSEFTFRIPRARE